MSEVIDFPSKSQQRAAAGSAEERARRERSFDVLYARDALMAALPAESLRHISGADLLLAASRAVAAVDHARHERLHSPGYDEHRTGGELGALDRMYLGQPSAPAASIRPGPEGAA